MLNDLSLLIKVLHDNYDLFDYIDTCPKLQQKFKEYFFNECVNKYKFKAGYSKYNEHKDEILGDNTPIKDIIHWSDRGCDIDIYCRAYECLGLELEEE